MCDPLQLTDAEAADLDELAPLTERLLPGSWTRGALATELCVRGGCTRLLRARDGALVGFSIARLAADEAEILAVGVDEPWRRRGLGRRLLGDAVGHLRARGARRIHLELRASNRAARALYEDAGFLVCGRRPRYYRDGEDALLMTLQSLSGARPGEPGPVPVRERADILLNRHEGGSGWRLGLRIPGWPGSLPGQFAMLSAGARTAVSRTDPLLPRPMAIYRETATGDGAEVEILYKVTGRGTGLLCEATAGQQVAVVGPLGRGFAVPESGATALLVGGGTGIASLYGLAAAAAGSARVSVLLGGRSRVDLMGREDFAGLDVDLEIATEDGSDGRRGLVTELLEDRLADAPPRALVYACGPTPMMRRCAELAARAGVSCQVSLENNMACGFGVCLGCAAPRTAGGYALVCRDGPVFPAAEVDWEGLA